MRIRRATERDIPWLLTQLRAFAAAYPVQITIRDAHAEVVLGTLIREQYVALAERTDADGVTRVGLIAGTLQPHPFDPETLCATSLFWFVTPEHRRSRAGALLFMDFESWAASTGAPIQAFSLVAGSAITTESFTRRGWQVVETMLTRAPGAVA